MTDMSDHPERGSTPAGANVNRDASPSDADASWAAAQPAQPVAPPAPAKQSRLPLFLILGGIAVFLAVVLYATRNNQSATDLAIGTCFDEPTATTDISTVEKHACTEAHDAEVFHVAEYSESAYPIQLSIDNFLDTACVPAFETYVGESFDTNETLEMGYFYPNREGWDNGDRTFTCYVVRNDGTKLSQSVKGSGGT